VAAVPDRISILLFFRLGRGCKQCVTLDICRNNFLSATDVRSKHANNMHRDPDR